MPQPPGGQYGTLTSSSRTGEGTISESYSYDELNRPIAKTYSGANVASQNWSLQESSQYDPNFGRPVRKTYPAASGASAQSIYLGYTLGGDAMQSGFASDYLPSDPRSSQRRGTASFQCQNSKRQTLQDR